MKTIGSVLRTMILFILLLVLILALVTLLGMLYVKVINLIEQQAVRYVISIIWFGGMAALVMQIGKRGMRRILDRD